MIRARISPSRENDQNVVWSARVTRKGAVLRYPSRDPASAQGRVRLPGGVILPPSLLVIAAAHGQHGSRPTSSSLESAELLGNAVTATLCERVNSLVKLAGLTIYD